MDHEELLVKLEEMRERLAKAQSDITAAHDVLEQQVVVTERLAGQGYAQALEIVSLRQRIEALEARLPGPH
jgi:predicted  nucleic acid-binding Zn-ribbon protein